MTTRRNLLLAAAAGPAMSLPAGICAAAPLDPIFAAIARNIEGWRGLSEACDVLGEVQLQLGFGYDGPELQAAEKLEADRGATASETLAAFLKTVPTTLPGIRAYIEHLDHVAAFEGVSMDPWHVRTVVDTLRAAVAQHVGA